MKLAYAYSWRLPAADPSQVRRMIDTLRQHALELGGEASSVSVRTGRDTVVKRPDASTAFLFTATMPGATEGRYGLAPIGNSSWTWSGAVVVSDVRPVGALHAVAAELGIEVVESYGGAVFTSRKNDRGAVEVEQRSAFEGVDF